MDIKFFLKVGADPRDRILNQRPPQGCSWVDGRLIKTQVVSRPETIWPQVWSSMSKCAQKKVEENTIFLRTKLKNLTPFSEMQTEVGNSSGTSNAVRYTKTHPYRQDTDTASCSVQSRQVKTPS